MTVGSDKLRLLRRIPLVQFDEDIRGYSKSQVDRVLETLAPLADEIEALQAQLQEANERADAAAGQTADGSGGGQVSPDGDFDETLRNTLLLAQRTADQTVREAEAKAEELRRDSTAKADSIKAGARTEAKELKGEAHAQREQMLADAESERAQLLAEALEHAESRKQSIEEELMAEQGLKRNELLAEIGELERTRDDLAADVSRFEDFLSDRRDGVRAALGEITAVLEDPNLLAEQETPDPQDIGLLEPEELTEVAVESYSITTLQTEVEAARHQAEEMAVIASEAQEAESDFSFEFDGADNSGGDNASEDNTGEDDTRPLIDDSDGSPAVGETDELVDDDGSLGDSFESGSDDDAFASVDEDSDSDSDDAELAQFEPAQFESASTGEESGIENDPLTEAVHSEEFVAEEATPSFMDESPEFYPQDRPDSFNSDFGNDHDVTTERDDPFATAGFATEFAPESHDENLGDVPVVASVTPDSVFSSVPETSDPSAYSEIAAEASDPAGLGIGVESPYAEAEVVAERPAMSGLAEQARSRLASRVSRLRDSAVPQGTAPEGEFETPPPPTTEAAEAYTAQPPAPVMEAAYDSGSFNPPPPQAGSPFASGGPLVGNEALPPVENDDTWDRRDGRPLHPDARIEDLPPDDPFLDELRQMTGGEQPAEDETLNRFLSENPESEDGGGWFNRRR